jgi:hypothetical protein
MAANKNVVVITMEVTQLIGARSEVVSVLISRINSEIREGRSIVA